MAKQRYTVQQVDGYLDPATLEYDLKLWCVMDGDAIYTEVCDEYVARQIAWSMNLTDKIREAVAKSEKLFAED